MQRKATLRRPHDDVSVGDGIAVSLSACRDSAAETAAGGSVALTIRAVQWNAAHDDFTVLEGQGTLSSFQSGGITMSGGYARRLTTDSAQRWTTRETYSAVQATGGAKPVVYNLEMSGSYQPDGSGSLSMTGTLGLDGERYALVQAGAFADNGNGLPIAGALRLQNAAGDAVVITARSGSLFDLALYPAGGATAAGTQTSLSWTFYLP